MTAIPPKVRRAIIAIPFFGALLLAAKLNRGADRGAADAAHPGFALRDETAAAGIHFVHRRPGFDPKIAGIEPHVAALGASVSVADFDGDGRPDLYFTNSRFGERNALYRNRGDGTFEDVASAAGLADLNRAGEGVSMGAIWGDIDNDGREDILVYRYGYLALYKNVDGRHFQDVTQTAGLRRWVNSNGAIWLDYDRDGLLDLYVTAYFRDIDLWHLSTTKIMHNSFEFATNGGKNLLFHNIGGARFEDVTDRMGVGSTRWTLAAA
ncbi:MAG: FG-GAP repeat domain-containing protein, partial [Gemmatimonadaceae bacterium]